ncbi:AAA family ATPase [Nocardia sp. SYP-A9097]|uniref:3'-5' exonuclease n=1 Tax=Nocardia sp. SYP-A9097 TaxID=2663237 RepID=UPI00129A407D|nr:3'-5' exonuclease [Nocardia sp. SYP-A9097]MRH92782.1 AAA family ATPase [Nocardia sp. SYP-A9097]
MRILPVVAATSEQLTLLIDSQPGVLIIRGAAGSGKTTTALLRLKQLCGSWAKRHQRLKLNAPVRVLVLTYNRTLEGYIAELARQQVPTYDNVELQVTTFAKYAHDLAAAIADDFADTILDELLTGFGMPREFLTDEVQYLLSRFEPGKLEDYVSATRDGRGTSPRMESTTRRRLLDEVIYPYQKAKLSFGVRDWNDIAVDAASVDCQPWDVVIVDEAQDFSANQIRAIMAHVAPEHSVTFVVDAAQRIYPRAFTWKEAGITQLRSKSLKTNHRNTRQIAAFARSVLNGMNVGIDGVLPDLDSATGEGPLPVVLIGSYSAQTRWVLENIVGTEEPADELRESVAFLHPKGGRWFSYTRSELERHHVGYVQLTRNNSWPAGEETVALSTIHSAKGLEFDHVVILGLNKEVTPHGEEDGDVGLETLRRLLARGIGRARTTVTLGFKRGAESTLLDYLDPATYTRIEL